MNVGQTAPFYIPPSKFQLAARTCGCLFPVDHITSFPRLIIPVVINKHYNCIHRYVSGYNFSLVFPLSIFNGLVIAVNINCSAYTRTSHITHTPLYKICM